MNKAETTIFVGEPTAQLLSGFNHGYERINLPALFQQTQLQLQAGPTPASG